MFLSWIGGELLVNCDALPEGRPATRHWSVEWGGCTLKGDCLSREPESQEVCLVSIAPGWSGTIGARSFEALGQDMFFVDGTKFSPALQMGVPTKYILWEAQDQISGVQLCRFDDPAPADYEVRSGECVELDEEGECVSFHCDVGEEKYEEDDILQCRPCAAGRFQNSQSADACLPCPVGAVASFSGATECELCEVGWYASSEDSTACSKCAPEVAPRFEQDFVKEELLESGSSEEVWRCQHRGDMKHYAVKIVNFSESVSTTNVLHEAQFAASAAGEHPHVVRFHAAWVQHHCARHSRPIAQLFIQMELCHGGSLHDWLRRREAAAAGSRSWTLNITSVVLDSAVVLRHWHMHGLIHGDINPRNMWLTADRSLRLGNFGLAAWASSSLRGFPGHKDRGWHTEHVGPDIYACPEEISSLPCDIFALGIIFAELLCPFASRAESVHALARIAEGILPEDLKVNFPQTADVILDMTHQNPRERLTPEELSFVLPTVIEEIESVTESVQ